MDNSRGGRVGTPPSIKETSDTARQGKENAITLSAGHRHERFDDIHIRSRLFLSKERE